MFPILLLLYFIPNIEAVINTLNDSQYYEMPALYAMDDYEACLVEPEGTYCVLDVDLHPGNNMELMEMIKEYSENTMKHYNYTQVHRGVCVPRSCDTHNTSIEADDLKWCLEEHLNNSLYTQYGLEGKVANILYCNKQGEKIQIDTSDITMAVVYFVLIMLNVVGSLYDVIGYNRDDKSGNPYILAFSIRRNWSRLIATTEKPHEPRLERLKLFHGLKTLTMFGVIFLHTVIFVCAGFISNPQFLEKSYDVPLTQVLYNGVVVSNTFFVMSGFLLAYNYQLHSDKNESSWWNLPKGMLLRWLRLSPTVAVVMFTITTWIRHAFQGPMWPMLVTSEAEACREYWWAHLFYINNYVYEDVNCLPVTWYLAADTQLFFLGLLVCVAVRNGRARAIALTLLFAISLAIVAAHTYFQDLDGIVMHTPESYRTLFASDRTFRLMYIPGHTNMSVYILGLAAGFLTYHLQKGKGLKKNKMYGWVIWLLVPMQLALLLSGGLFYSDEEQVPMLLRVLYATLFKPLFQFLVVALIFGTVFKFEKIIRGILEWRGFTWMSRVTYSAFLLHSIFHRTFVGSQMQLIHVSVYFVLMFLIATIFITYLFAVVLYLLVEAPAAQLVREAMQRPSSTNQ